MFAEKIFSFIHLLMIFSQCFFLVSCEDLSPYLIDSSLLLEYYWTMTKITVTQDHYSITRARGVHARLADFKLFMTQAIKTGLTIFEPNPLKLIRNPVQFIIPRIGLVWVGVDGFLVNLK